MRAWSSARFTIDLPPGHEDLFGINVAKMSIVIPEAARAPLRTIASAVVQRAQRNYRDHLHEPEKESPADRDPRRPAEEGGPSISGDWPLILRTVNETLRDDPGRRDDLLVRLANAFG